MNELMTYTSENALVVPQNENYQLKVGNYQTELVRDLDFGMIFKKDGSPMSKTPTLFKSGAEKVILAYGLCKSFAIESKIEDVETGFFHYLVRCDLTKIVNGEKYVITSSFGEANTKETKNGAKSYADSINNAIKMAQKRAMVDAAISIASISGAFTQDLESDLTEEAKVLVAKGNEKITAKQVTYLYTVAGKHGKTPTEAKDIIKGFGFASAKEITGDMFDAIVKTLSDQVVEGEIIDA